MWDAGDVETDPGNIGLAGSPTIVTGLAEAPYRERRREFLEGTDEEVVQQLVNLLQRES